MSGLSGITVNVGQGGLGRRALSQDGIAGLILYNDTPPAGFATTKIQKVFSIEEAETLGVTVAAFDVDHYHVSEFFRANPDGTLWIGYFDEPAGTYDFVEISEFQIFVGGEVRLYGVFAPEETYVDTQVTALQAAIDTIPSTQPVSAFLASDMAAIVAITGWGTISDLRTQTAKDVTVVTGQDGGAVGAALFVSTTKSVTVLGRILGDHSLAAVNQSVGEVGSFDISDGTELETPAMANGDLVTDLSLTSLGSVKDKGYAVIRKRLPDVSGTYHERTPTAVVATSDFSFIENVRVIDKATRLLNSAYVPFINSTVLFNPDGTLTDDVIGFFVDLGQSTLESNMQAAGEVSGSEVLIDNSQDVQGTSTLVITAKIQPTAIAEFITINIGFTLEL